MPLLPPLICFAHMWHVSDMHYKHVISRVRGIFSQINFGPHSFGNACDYVSDICK